VFANMRQDLRNQGGRVAVNLRRVDEPCEPAIVADVDIGAGATVLDPIKVGDNIVIGANPLVVSAMRPMIACSWGSCGEQAETSMSPRWTRQP